VGAAAENNLQEQTLAERWRLIERIGQGAMGEVWRGKHALLGHEIAVKLMRADAAKDRNLVGRFKREARIAAQLRHRNLVRVEDFGVTGDNRPFLVMEFLKGRTLGKFLEETPKPTLPTVLKIVQQMGAALDAAHAEGIVHRDLKPDNVYLIADDDGGLLVKVLDFGIAKVTDGMFVTANGVVTAAHALLGTPMYMSPEQARGDADVDKRSDLWSVGVMAFEMLTGRMPFEAPTVSQVLLQVLNAQVPSAAQMEPQLPPAIDAWFARALGREKPQRFQSGRELSSTLATVLGLAHPTPSIVPAVAIGGDPSDGLDGRDHGSCVDARRVARSFDRAVQPAGLGAVRVPLDARGGAVSVRRHGAQRELGRHRARDVARAKNPLGPREHRHERGPRRGGVLRRGHGRPRAHSRERSHVAHGRAAHERDRARGDGGGDAERTGDAERAGDPAARGAERARGAGDPLGERDGAPERGGAERGARCGGGGSERGARALGTAHERAE
jgi:tRNA A-37 threonylcarbamoyl transferase component Bud32